MNMYDDTPSAMREKLGTRVHMNRPKDKIAKALHDLTPISPFLGPPLPEKYQVYWPDFMLSSKPGLLTDLNIHVLNVKNKLANKVSGHFPYPTFRRDPNSASGWVRL